MKNTRAHSPRWVIFLIDLCFVLFSVALAYLIRFEFSISTVLSQGWMQALLVIVLVRSAGFFIAKTYSGIIRFTSTSDTVRIFLTLLFGTLVFVALNLISYGFTERHLIPYSIVALEFLSSLFLLISFRIFIKVMYVEKVNPTKEKENVVIYGAGESGLFTKRTLDRDAGTKYKVLAFIDDDVRKTNKKMEGVQIYPTTQLAELLKENKIKHVIISIQRLSKTKKQSVTEICLAHQVRVMAVPPVGKWINGELSFKQIKRIKIEELLERDEIKLDVTLIAADVVGKNVLVTGAAGSIGSEIVRQLARFSAHKIILVDQAETPLFHLEMELKEKFPDKSFRIIIADVCNEQRMAQIFEKYTPHVVYHAAAYKHVPMMELHPKEAVLVNVIGTKTIADLALAYGVAKFVMVSTDKAVNPSNIMGASKRIAEIYTQALNHHQKTKFITTRFGNVLGSNGSVVELFKKQIDAGGPITLTHPDINRFFMTIPEACQLVLEAGAMGKGGEIFIFDMGESVKIVDLAKKMITLSGLTLGKDIQIKYVGLRPGEKLYEELLNDKENTLPTHHDRIMIAKVRPTDFQQVEEYIARLLAVYATQDDMDMVKVMKQIVPEFLSKNSIYEQLDL